MRSSSLGGLAVGLASVRGSSSDPKCKALTHSQHGWHLAPLPGCIGFLAVVPAVVRGKGETTAGYLLATLRVEDPLARHRTIEPSRGKEATVQPWAGLHNPFRIGCAVCGQIYGAGLQLLANQAVIGLLVGDPAGVSAKPQGARQVSPASRREGRTLLEMDVGGGRPG